MKSRKFPHIHSAATADSAAQGFLLANSSAPQDDVAAATVRRFELQYNKSPRFARRRKERRQGQALLLAVLIMLLAALLSAGFLAVVSGNLNQSARVADKTRAIEASRAGIAYANAQLSGSSQGDLWRPVDVSPAPQPNDAAYNFYYSQLDKVQGWSAKRRPVLGENFPNADYPAPISNYDQALAYYRSVTYGKFPDPNQVAGDAPKFLVKVREVPSNINDPEYEADHVGEIKITSIGLSEDNPNVFNRAVAYKAGRKKSPWASALRSVSNWKFGDTEDTTGVPYGDVTAIATANPSGPVPVTINNTDKPQFSEKEVPFNVVIVKKDSVAPANSTVRGAVVTGVATTGTTTTLTLAKLDNNIVQGEVIQKAAAIGTGSTIDLLNTGTPNAIATNFPDYDQPNGILANGSLWLQNQVRLSNLSKVGTKMMTSGSFVIDNSATNVSKPILPGGDVAAAPSGNQLVPSNAGYPGNSIVLTATAVSDGVTKTDLINDGWDKIGAQTLGLDYSSSRDVNTLARDTKPFTPVKIDSATNLERYRALTRNSSDGVYINNRQDVERVGPTEMTQAEFLKMLTSDDAAIPYFRNGTAVAAGTVGSSLEQKHLRGWIGPDEFLARGALVELSPAPDLNGNAPSLRITLDARSDSTAAAPNNDVGPVVDKAVRNSNGGLRRGVYTQILPWPKNGTLLAEGNIRIRGKVNLSGVPIANAVNFPSLTIVSLGNIYIEGTVSVDGPFLADGVTPNNNRKKLMLMAKKNVVVNPTRLVTGHVDVQTVTKNAVALPVVPRTPLAVPVEDSTPFVLGDVVELGGVIPTAGVRAIVIATDATVGANTITVLPIEGNSIPAVTGIRTQIRDAREVAPSTVKYFVADAKNAVNRRVLLQDAQANYPNLRLALDHEAERKTAFTIETKDYGNIGPDLVTKPTGLEVKVTNKRVDNNTTIDRRQAVIERADKRLRATFNLPAPAGVDSFPDDPTDTAFTDATAQAFSLEALETTMNAVSTHVDIPNLKGWKYTATKTPALTAGIPTFYLAAVGLRYDRINASGVADYGIKDIGPNASKVEIPLATSVILARGYTGSGGEGLFATHIDVNGAVAEDRVDQLGFNPDFGVTTPLSAREDILTVDQSFYQTDADALNSTLDSRRVQAGFDTGISYSLRQNLDNLLLPAAVTPPDLPAYRVRALKLENTLFPAPATTNPLVIKPIDFNIEAFVYAQEGSWLMIPGDYFRNGNTVGSTNSNPVRSNAAGTATYIDAGNGTPGTANDGVAQPNEYFDANGNNTFDAGDFADLNRNGILDPGEAEAALRFVRYNYKVNFYGAIIENQTAVVADVKDAAGTTTLAKGTVQDWMDKLAAYDSTSAGTAADPKFKLINYVYDPSLALNTAGSQTLRVPVTDDLLYQQ